MSGDYVVGKGRPPQHTRWQKGGPSPNPDGARRRKTEIDVAAILGSPVKALVNGKATARHPFEAGFENLAVKAMKGALDAAAYVIELAIRYNLLKIPAAPDSCGLVLRAPKGWDLEEFREMYDAYGPPPWAGQRDGLTSSARTEATRRGR